MRRGLAMILLLVFFAPSDAATVTLRNANGKDFVARLDGIEVSFTSRDAGDHIVIEGVARNLQKEDRCIDVKLFEPMNCAGWRFGVGPEQEKVIDGPVAGLEFSGSAVYPLAAISGKDDGVCIAVPPTHPTRFSTGADETGVFIIFRIGLCAESNPPNHTAFRTIVFHHDPVWGFRSALQKYYDIFRDPYFTRRVKRIGAWTLRDASRLINPDLYAYHEISGHGKDIESDEKAGIYSLPYTIAGQRQIAQLPALPTDYTETMRVLESATPALRDMIKTSGTYDPDQKFQTLLRDEPTRTVVFPQNPNPKLFADSSRPTVARGLFDDEIPRMLKTQFVDGIYVDSLGLWGDYYNFRRDHFHDSTVPLTYFGDEPRVCLWNMQSHAEYLWELSRRLHEQGKIVFANGVHPDRVMLGFAVDAMGMEGLPSYTDATHFYSRRVAAGDKPYCWLNAKAQTSPRLWNSALYMGYLLGCNTPEGAIEERKFLPTIIKLNEAGWRPITHARADRDEVGIERWGDRMFTVMNRSTHAVETKLSIDNAALKINADAKFIDLLSGAASSLNLKLEPEQTIAFEVK